MPTYDYLCSGCGQTFEVFQKMSEEPLSSCPDCGAAARRKISGGAGFIFKGDGFYITDHRSKEYRDRAAADEGREKPVTAAKGETSKGGSAESRKKSDGKPASSPPGSAGSSSGTGSRKASGADPDGKASGTGSAGSTRAGSRR